MIAQLTYKQTDSQGDSYTPPQILLQGGYNETIHILNLPLWHPVQE